MTTWHVIDGDCVEAMAAMDEASVDAVVCDPPYGLEFMGKAWDRPWAKDFTGIGGGSPLPDRQLHVNPRCKSCGGYRRGTKNPCRCARPDWSDSQAAAVGRANRALQEWHEAWANECLRVLKPGGHLLAFGGTRTYHRLACAIEDAGFEIRDTICWLYGSGFPKSLDVSKAIDAAAGAERNVVGRKADPRYLSPATATSGAPMGGIDPRPNSVENYGRAGFVTAPATPDAERWQGWGTALKPAHEPIVVARKPLSGTAAANVLEHGTGALNVDGCRIGTGGGGNACPGGDACKCHTDGRAYSPTKHPVRREGEFGRWPANVVLDEQAAAMLDEQTGELASGSHGADERRAAPGGNGTTHGAMPGVVGAWHGDSGGASRFFYVAKASSAERNAGLEGFEAMGRTIGSKRCAACGRQKVNMPGSECQCPEPREWVAVEDHSPRANGHPTVKPIALMRWLVRLVTPPDGLVLDPFVGSGTTGCAAVLEGFRFLGIEREDEYAAIARARIAWWAEHPEGVELVDRLDAERSRKAAADAGQGELFGEVA